MTILALYFFLLLVSAQQGKVGLRVVEVLRIQHRDIRIPSLVFGMTGTAFLLFKPAVKSLVFQDIRLHILVAIRAQCSLRLLVEPDVAFLAIRFELGVSLDHFPGHQRGLTRPQRDTGNRQGQSQESNA